MKTRIIVSILVFLLIEALGVSVIYANGPWVRGPANSYMLCMTHVCALMFGGILFSGWKDFFKP